MTEDALDSGLRIRPARDHDVAAVSGIVTRAYGPYVERLGMEPGPMGDDHAAQVAAGRVWVAEDHRGVVGLIVLERHDDHVLIENVAVDPAAKGSGVGRALLEFAERHAGRCGVGELRLYTHEGMSENRALYARIGYAETEVRPMDGFALVFFAKRL